MMYACIKYPIPGLVHFFYNDSMKICFVIKKGMATNESQVFIKLFSESSYCQTDTWHCPVFDKQEIS